MRNYRGLTKDGKWVYGWYVSARLNNRKKNSYPNMVIDCILPIKKRWGDIYFDEGCNDEPIEVIPETVGQSTGLKDKNGKEEREIYGGDQYRGEESGTIYTVAFREGEYILVYDSISPPIKARKHCGLYHALHNLGIEYIGNIHEKGKDNG